MKTRTQQIEELQKEWTQPRWEGITRHTVRKMW
ncbi:isocitrate lyase [Escherichia coli]|nr:isocitrate lyase [Escherichia coli]